ncbi:hypothetical protein A3C59_03575 [Candidatus Daviesbacteria bacterium RIFCSPHIGHO2_02_FULL_36_13]|uniref:Gfo/Idh/MocA-like oxidoreductase N-terminal domain-containing protein n=1 Tax=Candidatus Daviesbacteria bacterium RIFCSPHIGHO2_02_FULL_36_13 TaxID=1797768 RepID=A0A1F5JQD3_9BACT|nr:MAG: hypothetical protein A3C59_03575 [Candidatus Daviesbacteria bacterium RIFCSPHIGHO2_02_FULL_36_13]OGE43731.1 MAG: hypothetical protein A3A45_02475 [Candidatus Daviesbacteria bacterium RIFCSPLOWO2_01_FULL_36_8]
MAIGVTERPNTGSPDGPKNLKKHIVVIGAAGQTGRLYVDAFSPKFKVAGVIHERKPANESQHPEVNLYPHTELDRLFKDQEPDFVILATPNPTEETLGEIAASMEAVEKPFILVLHQNGKDVVPQAEKVLKGFSDKARLVRAILWTNVSEGKNGQIQHNDLKISLAPIHEDEEALGQTVEAFGEAGFDVDTYEDYRVMEGIKLLGNLVGSTSDVTGLSPMETFMNRQLFMWELKAHKARIAALKAEGIELPKIPATKSLRSLAKVPTVAGWLPFIRRKVAKKTAAARNNQPSAAARKIFVDREDKVESTIYYHEAMYKMAEDQGLEDPIDRAIFDVLRINEKPDFSLIYLNPKQRIDYLKEYVGHESRRVYIPNSRFVRLITEGWFKFMSSRVFGQRFEVSGTENLQEAAQMVEDKNKVLKQDWEERKEKGEIKKGEEAEKASILVDPNHRAHPDHIALALAIRKVLGKRFPAIIVAGMLFENEILSRTLGNAYDRLLVWTVKNAKDPGEMARANIINRRADKAREQLMKTSRVWVTYLEGGRTKPENGEKPQLQKPIKGGSLWLKNHHFGAIVSAINRGTEKMLPPGRNIPGFASVFTRFGRVRTPDYFREEGKKEGSFAKRDGYISELAMKDIAEMLPRDERGVY